MSYKLETPPVLGAGPHKYANQVAKQHVARLPTRLEDRYPLIRHAQIPASYTTGRFLGDQHVYLRSIMHPQPTKSEAAIQNKCRADGCLLSSKM